MGSPQQRREVRQVQATLPSLVTVAPASGGRLYVVSADSVDLLDPDGTLRPVAGPGSAPDGILVATT